MKSKNFCLWCLIVLTQIYRCPASSDLRLWYDKPAQRWTEALPLGNGHMGSMVFGGAPEERIQFNEHTIWTGKPHEYHRPGASRHLAGLRDLLNDSRRQELRASTLEEEGNQAAAAQARKEARRKQQEAESLAMKEFMSDPLRQEMYQPCGDLVFAFPSHTNVSNYRRELDLDTATVIVSYEANGIQFRRECFVSYPDQVLVWRITANKPGAVSFTTKLTSPHGQASTRVEDETLVLHGQVQEGGVRFQARARVVTGRERSKLSGNEIAVENADSAVVLLTVGSSFRSYNDISGDPEAKCKALLRKAGSRDYPKLLERHLLDHQALFRRVSIDLGQTASASLPTDIRIQRFAESSDPALAALVFQYGRYLLIASSRPGGQPANLQGIWNDSLNPAWGSKYTVNINTEMNYWPAEVANLAECAEPLFHMIRECSLTGRKTAQAHYGARGWVLHHNTDLWRGTAPINNSNHGIWPSGGAWLCQHLWEHYLYSGDRRFLRRTAYPLMKEAALFFMDYLVEDPITGALISGPSNSPEQGGLVMAPAMDHQIARWLLSSTAQAARILNVDLKLAGEMEDVCRRIAPDHIGKHGQLQEWLEDKDDPANQHRHVSHLWAVFPGDQITPREPELFAAARQSLLYRGDAATGWSMGWKVNLWARFQDGDHAYLILKNLLRPVPEKGNGGGMYPNLFDAHPPFQIDGNFGASSGIAEMLLQSHRDEIVLLPALPREWRDGSATGLRARGGFEVDIVWNEGRLTEATVRSVSGTKAVLRYAGETKTLTLKKGAAHRWTR